MNFLQDPIFWSYFVFIVIIILAQVSIMVSSANWYKGINQPSLQPPPWVFTVVWTIIYLLLLYSVYQATKLMKSEWTLLYISFIINLFLNLIWTTTFFGQHNIKGGLFVIILLIISTIELMVVIYRISPVLSLCLVPYLIWLFVALYLNYQTLILNP